MALEMAAKAIEREGGRDAPIPGERDVEGPSHLGSPQHRSAGPAAGAAPGVGLGRGLARHASRRGYPAGSPPVKEVVRRRVAR